MPKRLRWSVHALLTVISLVTTGRAPGCRWSVRVISRPSRKGWQTSLSTSEERQDLKVPRVAGLPLPGKETTRPALG